MRLHARGVASRLGPDALPGACAAMDPWWVRRQAQHKSAVVCGGPEKSSALIFAGVIIGILDLIGEVKAWILCALQHHASGSETRISQLLSALLLPSGITMHRIKLL